MIQNNCVRLCLHFCWCDAEELTIGKSTEALFTMFYPSDILKKRGKFGFIWLAATKGKKLHRRQICSVDIVESSEDVMNVLSMHALTGIRNKVYFSLYLSSQLVGGLAYIADMQARFLLEDLKNMVLRLCDSKKPTIDLNKTLSKAKVTLAEFDINDVPLDFGCFCTPPEPSDHVICNHEYFLITTPKSSEESTPNTSLHLRKLPEISRDEESPLHLARREDITLTDVQPLQIEEPIAELEEVVDILGPPLPFIPPHSTQPEGAERLDSFLYDIEKPIFLTPEVIKDIELPPDPLIDSSLVQAPTLPPQRKTARMPSNDFVLPPDIPERRQRKRRRHMVVDEVTTLTVDHMKKNLESATTNLTTPMPIPSFLEPAKSLMTRLGSGFLAPRGILERLKKLKTLPKLMDDVSREEREKSTSPVRKRPSKSESVEQERAGMDSTKDPSKSGLFKSASIRTLEASSTLSSIARPEEVVGTSPLPFVGEEDYIFDKDLFRPILEPRHSIPFPDSNILFPEMDISEPGLVTEELPDQTLGVRAEKECLPDVSPERSPLPSSPPPLHEVLDEAFQLISDAAATSIIPNVTTFSALLLRTKATKRRAASLFYSMLCLHAEGKIFIQQPVTWGEIFTKIMLHDSS